MQGRVEKIPKKERNVVLEHLEDETMVQYMAKTNQYTDNEVEKKSGRNFSFWALVWCPAWRLFFTKYILDGIFLEGKRGFIRAQTAAICQFLLVPKVIVKRERNQQR